MSASFPRSVAALMVLAMAALASASATVAALPVPEEHRFGMHDKVPIIANKVGPYDNPTETYPYYYLPFCPPDELEHQDHELGELLSGDRKVNTPYEIRFRTSEQWQLLCEQHLTEEELERFATACEEDYYFEMFIDDMPVWGYVGMSAGEDLLLGHTDSSRHYLFTHLRFTIGYNGDSIVAVNVTVDPSADRVDITSHQAMTVRFSYSVEWEEMDLAFKDRMNHYAQDHFLPDTLEIHWLSIMNILVLVLLLTAFLAVILMKVVNNDFTRYMQADDDDMGEETGWKLLHADVFRIPQKINLLCAVLGSGAQLFCMTFALLCMALLGLFPHTKRGSIVTACIVLYTLSAGIGGFVSSRLYRQFGGQEWVRNILLNASIFPGPLLAVFAVLNTVAIAHSSTAALPFGTIMVVLLLFLLVNFPLSVLGGIAGRNTAGDFKAPCAATKVPRQIPKAPFYRSAWVQIFVAGFLPFSAISIELHYIFAAVWGHMVYTLFGILFLAFVLCAIVTSFIVIALTYFQLAIEDHRWWWRALMSGGSVGIFVFLYCFVYYFQHSEMSGLLQTSFFFGYMGIVAYGFFLMLAFVGFMSSFAFVRYIYARIKTE